MLGSLLFGVLAAGAGVAHAALLARTVQRRAGPFGFVLRLALVAVVLVAAAKSGHLLVACAAWIVAFVAAASVAYRRLA